MRVDARRARRRSPTAPPGLRVVRVLEALQRSLDASRREGVARTVALTGAERAAPAAEAVGLVLGDGVRIGDGVRFGAHVVVHDGTVIGDGCVIEHGAVLGKRAAPRRAARPTQLAPLRSARATRLRSAPSRYAGSDRRRGDRRRPGAGARAHAIGERTVIGAPPGIDNDVRIGARVKVQSQVYVTAHQRRSRTTSSSALARRPPTTTRWDRHGPDYALRGATIRRAARIGGSARAGARRRDRRGGVRGRRRGGHERTSPARAFMVGVPARQVREVADAELLEPRR